MTVRSGRSSRPPRRGALPLVALLAVALTACASGDTGEGSAAAASAAGSEAAGGDGGAATPAPDGTIAVWADDLEFSTNEIHAPAGEAFTIEFENREGAPHNIAIYTDDSRSEALFVGDIITGPETITYEVPALDAGEYYFVCDVHPQMEGTVIVDG